MPFEVASPATYSCLLTNSSVPKLTRSNISEISPHVDIVGIGSIAQLMHTSLPDLTNERVRLKVGSKNMTSNEVLRHPKIATQGIRPDGVAHDIHITID